MLVFNHDFDCFCIGDNRPRCVLRKECMLNHVESNFKDAKNREVNAGVEIIKKNLKEGVSRESIENSFFVRSAETTETFKKFR